MNRVKKSPEQKSVEREAKALQEFESRRAYAELAAYRADTVRVRNSSSIDIRSIKESKLIRGRDDE